MLGLAVAGVVAGGIGVLTAWSPWFALPLALVALVLGLVALFLGDRPEESSTRTLAIVAVSLAGLTVLATVVLWPQPDYVVSSGGWEDDGSGGGPEHEGSGGEGSGGGPGHEGSGGGPQQEGSGGGAEPGREPGGGLGEDVEAPAPGPVAAVAALAATAWSLARLRRGPR